jgi:hypothetical protein
MVTLSYRGKPKYIIVEIDKYEKLKELELLIAYSKIKKEIENGEFEIVETEKDLEKHLKELKI